MFRMRRRFALLWTMVVLGAALALPATTAAGSGDFSYTIKSNTCSSSGGQHGYGHIYFKVKLQEMGHSGANKFTFDAKVQHRNLGSSHWSTEWTWSRFTYTFADNGNSTWYTRWYSYDPDEYAWHRIVMTLKVWDGGYLLASRKLNGKYC
jgi:aspartate/tyrosine/aromatic aminotransferase